MQTFVIVTFNLNLFRAQFLHTDILARCMEAPLLAAGAGSDPACSSVLEHCTQRTQHSQTRHKGFEANPKFWRRTQDTFGNASCSKRITLRRWGALNVRTAWRTFQVPTALQSFRMLEIMIKLHVNVDFVTSHAKTHRGDCSTFSSKRCDKVKNTKQNLVMRRQ